MALAVDVDDVLVVLVRVHVLDVPDHVGLNGAAHVEGQSALSEIALDADPLGVVAQAAGSLEEGRI